MFCALLLLALLFGLTLLWLELRHRLRPASPLRLSSGPWTTRWNNEGAVTLEGISNVSVLDCTANVATKALAKETTYYTASFRFQS
jgi:hypothetical protein